MNLSEKDRIMLLIMRGFGNKMRSYEETANLFNDTYPDRNPVSKSTVLRTVARYEQTGSVQNKTKSGRPKSARNDDSAQLVLQAVVENPGTSTRKMATQLGMSRTSVRRVLKEHHYHPFKMHLVQELLEGDFDHRLEFCEEMMLRYDENRNFFNWICFSDEATFELNGNVNRHNMRYWCDENPHRVRLLV